MLTINIRVSLGFNLQSVVIPCDTAKKYITKKLATIFLCSLLSKKGPSVPSRNIPLPTCLRIWFIIMFHISASKLGCTQHCELVWTRSTNVTGFRIPDPFEKTYHAGFFYCYKELGRVIISSEFKMLLCTLVTKSRIMYSGFIFLSSTWFIFDHSNYFYCAYLLEFHVIQNDNYLS